MLLSFLSSLNAHLQMFVACFFMIRVSVKVTPRFLAKEEIVMSELPIEIEELFVVIFMFYCLQRNVHDIHFCLEVCAVVSTRSTYLDAFSIREDQVSA